MTRLLKMNTDKPLVEFTQSELLEKKRELDDLEVKFQKLRARIYNLRRDLKDGFKRKRG